ncbi:MAG: adenylate/guanylate cyclase domain-containing protein [Chloroflexi bacterium]|nr:MAG: adenylate/guanylate cyclase domain-containing protein [Chloroflexota bacterium]
MIAQTTILPWRRGLIDRSWRALYRRAPERYFRTVAALLVLFAVLVAIVASLFSAFYLRMTGAQLLILTVVWSGLYAVEAIIGARIFLRVTRPVATWMGAERDPVQAEQAWYALASAPLRLLRQRGLYGIGIVEVAIFNVGMITVLGMPAFSFLVMAPGCVLTYLYWIGVRFFALEIASRPVLEEISTRLPDRTEIAIPKVPLRWRLAAALPGVNIVTGVVVAGVTNTDLNNLGRMGLGILAAVGVTATISIWLTSGLSESVVGPVVALREAARGIGRGDLSTRVPVVSTDETGELARAFNAMAAGLEERERLREAFGTFVDPDLAEKILRDGTDLSGDEVDLSVLFLDVRGFTSFAERSEAHEVVSLLNDLYGCIVPVILRHGGHANKFIGDGLLAVFGAPDRLVDHADRAVEAALEITQLVRSRYNGKLRVGIGVNSGKAVVGTIGGGGRLDFTVIGDTVNTAARVESATRQTDDDVLITDATLVQLRSGRKEWRERATVPLKGKSHVVRLFAPSHGSGDGVSMGGVESIPVVAVDPKDDEPVSRATDLVDAPSVDDISSERS